MRLIVCKNYDEMSKVGARLVASQLTLKPDSVLGFATGSTPVGVYNELSDMYARGELDFSEAVAFNLDEYYPIARDNEQSYYYFMQKNLFEKINIKTANIPNGSAEDADKECAEYSAAIKTNGGIDLQILGIGNNGHIGFNEPDTELFARTHVTALTESTIMANSRFFENESDVPRHAMTMGMADILDSKKIIMLVSGRAKHTVLRQLLEGKITTNNPATLLNLHSDVVVICDKDAYNG